MPMSFYTKMLDENPKIYRNREEINWDIGRNINDTKHVLLSYFNGRVTSNGMIVRVVKIPKL